MQEYSNEELGETEQPTKWADITEDETNAHGELVYHSVTGHALKHDKVMEARMDEVRALEKMGVWEMVNRSMCMSRTGRPPIKGGWVDVNKGDDVNDNYRSRYVAKEIKQADGGADREGLFAHIPPLEALKLVISAATSRVGLGGTVHKLMFLDISKAYLHAPVIDENLFVELPKEMGSPTCAAGY